MRTSRLTVLILIVSSMFFTVANAAQPTPSSWDHASAMAAVNSVNIDIEVNRIANLPSLADGPTTIKNLRELESRSDWPLPAREAVLFQFTRSLATLPRDAVDKDIMQHLSAYQARVLVPHEDHPENAIPLFNIRGAAAGVENGWLRNESMAEALLIVETDSTALISKYLDTDEPAQQSGYLDALRLTDTNEVQIVQSAALEQLQQSPELTRLLATTSVLTADPYAIRRVLVDGQGAALATTFRKLGAQLDVSETATLLRFAIEQAPTQNAGLAIAAWWPVLRNDAATRQLMLDTLEDDKLGSSAALALAQSPDIQTIHQLQLVAESNSTAARRAKMALDINRDLLIGEVRQ